jgi:plastocyanin
MVLATQRTAQCQTAIVGTVQWRGNTLEDAVVYLGSAENGDYVFSADTVLIDQVALRFSAPVVAIPAGTTVQFRNSDPTMHNVFSPERRGADFNLGTYPRNESRFHTFTAPGSYVVLCHVHPEMAVWIVVTPTRLNAVTDDQGAFRIDGVRPGAYLITASYRGRSDSPVAVSVPIDGIESLRLEVR